MRKKKIIRKESNLNDISFSEKIQIFVIKFFFRKWLVRANFNVLRNPLEDSLEFFFHFGIYQKLGLKTRLQILNSLFE